MLVAKFVSADAMTPFGCARSARTDPFTGISILADEQLRSDFSQLLTSGRPATVNHSIGSKHPHTPKGATAHKATKLPLTPTLHTVTDCTLKLNLTHSTHQDGHNTLRFGPGVLFPWASSTFLETVSDKTLPYFQ